MSLSINSALNKADAPEMGWQDEGPEIQPWSKTLITPLKNISDVFSSFLRHVKHSLMLPLSLHLAISLCSNPASIFQQRSVTVRWAEGSTSRQASGRPEFQHSGSSLCCYRIPGMLIIIFSSTTQFENVILMLRTIRELSPYHHKVHYGSLN